jgi:dethiobiotin synthetase
MLNSAKGLIVTGTDTGVGKTLVSALVAGTWLQQGKKVALYKPVETGITQLQQSDTHQVSHWLTGLNTPATASLSPVVGHFFEAPATPAVANTTGQALQLNTLLEQANTLAQTHDALVIEGAGGLYVPLTPYACMLDLFRLLKLPCLLVARPNLGTLNHTLLSYHALRKEGITVLAVLINESAPLSPQEKESLAVKTAQEQLQHWLPCPVLAGLPYQQDLQTGGFASLLKGFTAKHPAWQRLLESL